MNKIAIMQPYIFPFLGYFSLVDVVDNFVFYDDVNFVKKGWVNRNNILINGNKHLFTIPLKKASQNSKINEIQLSDITNFKEVFLKSLKHSYSKSNYYNFAIDFIEDIFNSNAGDSISDLASISVKNLSNLIGLDTSFYNSSDYHQPEINTLKEDRLIEIAKIFKSYHYINSYGGIALYDKDYFKSKGINLSFIEFLPKPYTQLNSDSFVENLSYIDCIMNIDIKEIKELIRSYNVI